MSVKSRLTGYLDQADMPYDEDGDVLRLSFTDGDTGLSWTCVAYAYDDEDLLVFFSVAPDDVPEDRRAAVAEYLTRANYGLPLGNFEMDWSDGEVRCRTSVHIADAPLTLGVIRSIVATNLGLMMRYLPGLLAVVRDEAGPEAAVAAAEDRTVPGPAL